MKLTFQDKAPESATVPHCSATEDVGVPLLTSFGRRTSASEFAYGQLRDAIISLALPPGSVLSRNEIARQLGISQTPMREAIVRLQEERLVEVVPQSATRVSRVDLASAREAHFLRLSIELEIVRRLAGSPSPALARVLEAELSRMEAGLAAGNHTDFTAADEAFHSALYSAAEVPNLRALVRSRSGHLDRLRRLHLPSPGKAEAVLDDHRELALAMMSGDARQAEARLRAHMSGTFAEIERLRATLPNYFQTDVP
ncbi:GntR family transcriptional regulator [Muricoccus aerilatus]|uniref:GntR family transcriptional regulator n=1 Tax=Muricoccus aerilatus TaxID=452982 RepID=UPI000A03E508|nr:GntR family transcriptional regulator [Roseomonas aerilata]